MTRLIAVIAGLLWAGAALAEDLTFHNAWVRETPPGMTNGAGFGVLVNPTEAPTRLVAVEAPVAARVELHTHVNDDGVMRMRQVAGIEVPAGGKTVLEPRGLHIMFMGLNEPLQAGETVPLTLRFEDGETLEVAAPVRRFMGGMQHDAMDHGSMDP